MENNDIRYSQLHSVLPSAAERAENLLMRMTATGVLIADIVDKAPACPECGSLQLSTRYLCPKCFGFDIARSYLYEHLKCGKVASDDAFKKGEQVVCPKCQSVLHNFGVEYRAVGAWYKCNSCNESFNVPTHSHFCRPKDHHFTADRTRLVPIYQYRLNPKALSEIKREVLLYSDIIDTLEGLGLEALAPHTLPGKSGRPQTFDIVANLKGRWGSTKTIAIDVATSEEGVPVEVVRDFANKVRDAKPSESYLLAMPRLTEDAKDSATKLRVTFIEGASLKEATGALLDRGALRHMS
jgi:predicted RNA-binding Zn-ribbon protein involved in translation (DUF1610 family)